MRYSRSWQDVLFFCVLCAFRSSHAEMAFNRNIRKPQRGRAMNLVKRPRCPTPLSSRSSTQHYSWYLRPFQLYPLKHSRSDSDYFAFAFLNMAFWQAYYPVTSHSWSAYVSAGTDNCRHEGASQRAMAALRWVDQ
jgi:hypothetical protein